MYQNLFGKIRAEGSVALCAASPKRVLLFVFRQARSIVSHQPRTRFACRWAVVIHYLLVANAVYARQIYSATPIKCRGVTAWKAIMRVEAAGLKGSER